jgi:acyl-CoA thioesterase
MTQPEDTSSSVDGIRQRFNHFGYAQLLGMQIETAQEGIGTVRIHVDPRLMHPQQVVHGGVIFTLADTAMSTALMSVIPPYTRFSTIEAKINFMRPVRSGELMAEGHIVHRGRSTAVLEATVYNIDGEERQAVARALGTFNISSSKYEIPASE